MGRFLPYTRYPVYRIPVLFPEDYSGNIEYVMESCLYDLENDYEQLHNLMDAEKETEMCKKLVAGMQEAEAPAEQYRRLGVEISNAMHLSGWLGREVTLPLDEELFLQELNKKRVSSKKKTGVQELTLDVDGSYGNRP